MLPSEWILIGHLLQDGWLVSGGTIPEFRAIKQGGIKIFFDTNGHHCTWFLHEAFPDMELCFIRHTVTVWSNLTR